MHVHQAKLVVKQGRMYLIMWRLNINLKKHDQPHKKTLIFFENLINVACNKTANIVVILPPSVRLLSWHNNDQ